MTVQQAKAIAGIPFSTRIRGRKGREWAMRHCVKLIIEARRAGADTRAADLSAAKEVFKKLFQSFSHCRVCGVAVSRGCKQCQMHMRSNRLAACYD